MEAYKLITINVNPRLCCGPPSSANNKGRVLNLSIHPFIDIHLASPIQVVYQVLFFSSRSENPNVLKAASCWENVYRMYLLSFRYNQQDMKHIILSPQLKVIHSKNWWLQDTTWPNCGILLRLWGLLGANSFLSLWSKVNVYDTEMIIFIIQK